MGTFTKALAEMQASGSWHREPQSFADYLDQNELPKRDTASSISVDSVGKLDPELREARVMVFRLGAEPGQRGTRFALAKAKHSNLSDYFALDDELFSRTVPELFIPSVSYQSLFGFTLLPRFTETSLVNLAVFSGLLGHALRLDKSAIQSAPATGQSVFSFEFRPRADMPITWKHTQGQVEIDAVFAGQRSERPVAIIVESKASDEPDSLAKHKLLYPFLALRPMLPRYMDIVLVYLRAIRTGDAFNFFVAECGVSEDRPAIDTLTFSNPRQLVLKI